MNQPTNTSEENFNEILLQHSPLYAEIIKNSRSGTADNVHYILELNGKSRRPYPQKSLAANNLKLATLGIVAQHEYFDAGILCENLTSLENQDELASLVQASGIKDQIGSILIAHQTEHLTALSLAESVINSFTLVQPGGSVYVLDTIGWNNKRELLHGASKAIKDTFSDMVEVTRYAIMPVLTIPFAKSIASMDIEKQFSAIANEVKEGTKNATVIMTEITIPINQEYNPSKLEISGTKIAVPKYGDEILKFKKLTQQERDNQTRMNKERNRRSREQKRKAKNKRKK